MGKKDNKNQEKHLYDERERMDLILSTLNTGLLLLDPELTVVWANAMILKMFPDENLFGKKCFVVAENRSEPCEGCQSVLAFKDGEMHEREFQNQLNKRWYQVLAMPIKDDKGRVVNVLEATTDINDRKQVELERDKILKELKALQKKLEEENIYLKSEISDSCLFAGMIGTSNALRYVKTRVEQVAPTDSSVLILGETGVGKELVARAIHENSNRSLRPFIKINCAAITANLVESELFGHEKGAFTDAILQHKGRFELADTGTLFLDEISELPQKTQAKLLHVLQDGEFERVGGSRAHKCDVRIIAATNRDLNGEVAAGRFRADLFYRLNVYPITVPPLRKRREDIPLLVKHLISLTEPRIGKKIDSVPKQLMKQLRAYDWPGNVRELRNVLERSIITSRDSTLQLSEDLIKTPHHSSAAIGSAMSLEEVQRQHIQAVLEQANGRIEGPGGAAEILQLKPSTLRNRMKKLGIKR